MSGVQAGRHCFCGKALQPGAKKLANTRCNNQCPGNNQKWCGGHWAMNVYRRLNSGKCKIAPAKGCTKHLGCFQDDGKRILPKAYIASGKNTPMKCARHCKKRGFPFSGVQAGSQCFCGKEIAARAKKIRRTRCNSICPGNRSKWCGGGWAMNIYRNTGNKFQACPSPPQKGCRRHLGCYKDGHKRILPKAYVVLAKNSPALCSKHCT